MDRLVPIPTPGTDGSPPADAGDRLALERRRSPDPSRSSMKRSNAWQPPVETNARRHSVFVDVELWDEAAGKRVWSCAMLAAVWQLLRLGLLRTTAGCCRAAAAGRAGRDGLPETGTSCRRCSSSSRGPRRSPRTAPSSILDQRFLSVEHAVRVILSQVRQDPEAIASLADRAEREGLRPVDDVLGRVGYVFMPDREF